MVEIDNYSLYFILKQNTDDISDIIGLSNPITDCPSRLNDIDKNKKGICQYRIKCVLQNMSRNAILMTYLPT